MSLKIKNLLMWVFLTLALCGMAWYKLTQPRILVLHSYATDYTWARDIDIGLKRVLDKKLGYKVLWHYMDTKNHPDKEFRRKAGAMALRAINALKPQLIIAIDDDAQAYAVKEFAGNPEVAIIFAGINGSVEPYGYDKVSNATGIYERKPFDDLRRALLEMRTKEDAEMGRRILQLGDESDSVRTDVKEIAAFDWAPFEVTDSTLVSTFDRWKKAVMESKDKADIILISNYRNIYEDAGKQKLVSPTEIMKWTEANSPLPVVGMGGFMVEEGGMFAVGASGFEQGEVTARMAIQVVDKGVVPKTIPQVMPRQFLVYMRRPLLQKHGIVLPPLYEAFARASNNYYD